MSLYQSVVATLAASGRVSLATPRYSSTCPGPAPSAAGISVAAPRKVFRVPTSSSSPGRSAPAASRVSTVTLASPKSGSSARSLTVTGASGGTRTTFSTGSSIVISGARSGSTSMRYSILSTTVGSRCESDAALG